MIPTPDDVRARIAAVGGALAWWIDGDRRESVRLSVRTRVAMLDAVVEVQRLDPPLGYWRYADIGGVPGDFEWIRTPEEVAETERDIVTLREHVANVRRNYEQVAAIAARALACEEAAHDALAVSEWLRNGGNEARR